MATTYDAESDTYVVYNDSGEVLEQRPASPDERESLPPALGYTNAVDLTAKVAAQIPDLLVMIEGLQARLDIPKADLGNTELRRTIRDVRVLARDVIQLARLVGNVLDSTDSGTP